MLPFLLDTCALLWLMEGSLPSSVVRQLEAYVSSGATVRISPISAWELGLLVARRHISLPLRPLAYWRRILALPEIVQVELTPEILINSSFLPGEPPRDPFARMLIATAREAGFTLVTRDRALLDYAAAGFLRALAC